MYLLQLIQAAVASGSPEIQIRLGRDAVDVEWTPLQDANEKLEIALESARAENPRALLSRPGLFQLSKERGRSPSPAAEASAVARGCAFCPVPVYLDSRLVNAPFLSHSAVKTSYRVLAERTILGREAGLALLPIAYRPRFFDAGRTLYQPRHARGRTGLWQWRLPEEGAPFPSESEALDARVWISKSWDVEEGHVCLGEVDFGDQIAFVHGVQDYTRDTLRLRDPELKWGIQSREDPRSGLHALLSAWATLSLPLSDEPRGRLTLVRDGVSQPVETVDLGIPGAHAVVSDLGTPREQLLEWLRAQFRQLADDTLPLLGDESYEKRLDLPSTQRRQQAHRLQ